MDESFVQRMLEIPHMSRTLRSLLFPTAFFPNTRGLLSKLTSLYTNRFSLSSHVVLFTETWLKLDILSSEVLPSNYTTYRLDCPTRHVGRVLTAVDSKLTSEELNFEERNDIEFLGTKLALYT